MLLEKGGIIVLVETLYCKCEIRESDREKVEIFVNIIQKCGQIVVEHIGCKI